MDLMREKRDFDTNEWESDEKCCKDFQPIRHKPLSLPPGYVLHFSFFPKGLTDRLTGGSADRLGGNIEANNVNNSTIPAILVFKHCRNSCSGFYIPANYDIYKKTTERGLPK